MIGRTSGCEGVCKARRVVRYVAKGENTFGSYPGYICHYQGFEGVHFRILQLPCAQRSHNHPLLFLKHANVLAFSKVEVREKAAFLVRQHLMHNLYDRLGTRPFLGSTEKRWILFQLLKGSFLLSVPCLEGFLLTYLLSSSASVSPLGHCAWRYHAGECLAHVLALGVFS